MLSLAPVSCNRGGSFWLTDTVVIRYRWIMGRVQVFEDLIAWQKARTLARLITQITSGSQFTQDFKLRGQLRSAAASVMSNIAEGFDRNGRREFHQFLSIAKGSVAEVRSLVHFSRDAGMLGEAEYHHLLQQCREVSRIIAGLRRSIDPKTRPNGPTKH